jgi:hypothetical protein
MNTFQALVWMVRRESIMLSLRGLIYEHFSVIGLDGQEGEYYVVLEVTNI